MNNFMLKETQINKIRQAVEKQNVNFSHLKDDLIDHLGCEIEVEMTKGSDFDSSFEIVLKDIGINGLKKIEHSAISLINLKILERRKLLFAISSVGIILLLISLIFSIIQFSQHLIIISRGLGLLTLLLFVTIFFINNLRKKGKNKKVFLNISGLIASMLSIASVIFMMWHWPYRDIVYLINMFCILFVFTPIFIYYTIKEERNRYINYGFILLILFVSILDLNLFFFQKTNPLNQYNLYDAGVTDALNYLDRENERLIQMINTKENSNNIRELILKSDELYNYIAIIRGNIQKATTGSIISKEVSFDDNEIRHNIERYKCFVIKSFDGLHPELKNIVNKSLSAEFPTPGLSATMNLYQPNYTVINNLTRFLKDLRFIEREILLQQF
jgi:hypothetical protein